jgi:predicted Zn-dependent protease
VNRHAVLAALLACAGAGCSRNPATGVGQLTLVDEPAEIAMGLAADRQLTARLGLVEDERLQAYVAAVGEALAAGSERPRLPWRFRVLDDPAVNAFALPGGFVYVTRGLLAHLGSEADLAAVLGHEVGHVTARHSARRDAQARLASVALAAGALVEPRVGLGLDVAAAGVRVMLLELGRGDEREADALGVRYAARSGYETGAFVPVLRTLGRVEAAQPLAGVPWLLATHPASEERIRAIRALVDGRGRVRRREYLGIIDGLVFGDDPRSGYLRGRSFVHPGLGVSLDLPRAWVSRRSGRAALTSVSPDGDAALTLAAVAADSAERAARAFAASTTLRASSPRAAGGAWECEFEHRAGDGERWRGVASFAAHAGRVVRLVGYARGSSYDARRAELSVTAASLRAADVAAVTLRRIQLVDAGPLRLGEFLAAWPSAAPERTVAMINGLEPGDRESVVPQPAKRIVEVRYGVPFVTGRFLRTPSDSPSSRPGVSTKNLVPPRSSGRAPAPRARRGTRSRPTASGPGRRLTGSRLAAPNRVAAQAAEGESR